MPVGGGGPSFVARVVLWIELSTLALRVASFPEQGKWNFSLSSTLPAVNISKSLFKNSAVEIKESFCHSEDNADVLIKITSLKVFCSISYLGFNYVFAKDLLERLFISDKNGKLVKVNSSFQNSPSEQIKCRDAIVKTYLIASDGIFLITVDSYSNKPYNISVSVEVKGDYGYLSAIDWPLLPFYSTMCCVYVIYGFFWMIICFCYWKDLLRIQLWIGAVIFIGLVEKAVFVAEYESINESGKSVQGAVITAEIVSCLKRTLARMLVIITSLGFGITKPRLGSELPKVTTLGIFYFVLSSAEAIIRILVHKADASLSVLLAIIPLSVTDALICWWIFSSLIQTIRTLILKKNAVKLTLYRHFRNTMILAVIASVVYMIWSFKTFRLARCITDWKELWIDEAFWHILFSAILLVIIVLWRPSANNQREEIHPDGMKEFTDMAKSGGKPAGRRSSTRRRSIDESAKRRRKDVDRPRRCWKRFFAWYAYSPLQDLDDGEEDELVYDALGDVKKVRNMKNRSNSVTLNEDEHLKWIEENIPTSILDIELPGLLESDSEVNQHQVKISKML